MRANQPIETDRRKRALPARSAAHGRRYRRPRLTSSVKRYIDDKGDLNGEA